MSSYFDRFEKAMSDAVVRRAHRPWYVRLLSVRRTRAVAVVLAALVVAAPSVGAATNWYGLGAPDKFPKQSATASEGQAIAITGELTSLRVPDPNGGPPWGLSVVRTTRGDTCIQVGRVQNGKLGSLGIDGAWHNDRLFHPFPKSAKGYQCGTTDAAGHGFVNVSRSSESASANPVAGPNLPQGSTCRTPVHPLRPRSSLPPAVRRRAAASHQPPDCPAGAARFVFMGLLGPDATSVTYQAPDGSLKTEKTSRPDGAYLLVFPFNSRTCSLYSHSAFQSVQCGNSESFGGPSPGSPGAVRTITYKDGHTCQVRPPQKLLTAYKAMSAKIRKLEGNKPVPLPRDFTAPERKLYLTFFARTHTTQRQWLNWIVGGRACPPVGYVAPKEKRITAAAVATPISVKTLPREAGEITVDIRFKARQPVTSSHSWYEDYLTNPTGCPSSGQGGIVKFGNIHAGQIINDKRLVGTCTGTYHGLIGYMQNSGPINSEAAGGGIPGKDGTVIVGRFSFTAH